MTSLLIFLASTVFSFGANFVAPVVPTYSGGTGTLNQLQLFKATTTPYNAITTNQHAKNIYAPFSSATTTRLAANTYCINLTTPDCITAWPTGGTGGNSKWATSTGSLIIPNGGGGILVNSGTSTITNLRMVNASSTEATTTNLTVTGNAIFGFNTSLPWLDAGGSLRATTTPTATTFYSTGLVANRFPYATSTAISSTEASSTYARFGFLTSLYASSTALSSTEASSTFARFGALTSLYASSTALSSIEASSTFARFGNLIFLNASGTVISTTEASSTFNRSGFSIALYASSTALSSINASSTFFNNYKSVITFASTTAVSASEVCLTGDVCRSTWPTGGNSKWATTTDTFSIFANGGTNQNVGIGTSSPNWRLQVASTSASATFKPQLVLTDMNAGADAKHWAFTSVNGFLRIGTTSDTFSTSTYLTIDGVGRVGIGTSTPYAAFSVSKADSKGQVSIAYDTTHYAEFRTDASGDFNIGASANDVYLNNDNLWVCTGGSFTVSGCPPGNPSGQGNLFVETNVGIATATPAWNLQVATTSASATFKGQLNLTDTNAGTDLKHWTLRSIAGRFEVGSSSDVYATTTLFSITNASTTFSKALFSSSAATSSLANGLNLTSGCFSIGGTCIGGGAGSITGTGVLNAWAYWTSATNLSASSSPTVDYITATSTTATSTFRGPVQIFPNSVAAPALFVGTTTTGCPLYGCVQGDMVDGEYDFNGVAAFNIANGFGGTCAASGIFADGNIVALNSDYSFFGFLNTGWTGSGCAVGNGTERPESTLISNPTGDMIFELGSTSNAVAYKWYTKNTTLSMVLTNDSGKLGVGTTTPWSALSISSSTPYYGINGMANLFSVSTSSNNAGSLFNVFATSSIHTTYATGTEDSGARVLVGTANQYGTSTALDQLVVNGRTNNIGWNSAPCSLASNTTDLTIDTGNLCGGWTFQLDGAGGLLAEALNQGGNAMIIESREGLNNGAGFFQVGSSVGGFLAPTSTPIMEVSARIRTPQTATTTSFYVGFSNLATNGTAFETEPSVGCWFVASSSKVNWQALCRTAAGSNATQIDTGIASSTVFTNGHLAPFRGFRLEMDATKADFYMRTQDSGGWTHVARITTNYPTTTGLGAGLHIGKTGGSTIDFDFFGLKLWWRESLFNP